MQICHGALTYADIIKRGHIDLAIAEWIGPIDRGKRTTQALGAQHKPLGLEPIRTPNCSAALSAPPAALDLD